MGLIVTRLLFCQCLHFVSSHTHTHTRTVLSCCVITNGFVGNKVIQISIFFFSFRLCLNVHFVAISSRVTYTELQLSHNLKLHQNCIHGYNTDEHSFVPDASVRHDPVIHDQEWNVIGVLRQER